MVDNPYSPSFSGSFTSRFGGDGVQQGSDAVGSGGAMGGRGRAAISGQRMGTLVTPPASASAIDQATVIDTQVVDSFLNWHSYPTVLFA